ncbi:MAG: aspartyl/asparaginyl beta-hydroxylase domain-containing protein [Kordiimonadaceae bacterium]|nr:aspartyl/asparaginyl beta-hydroxylase domain-containing protein [Kordiimonadaceae bacterium]MBO6568673.1 aspartyl/asparaginyl beta-hydroxylase domain-containing protein [Kordiimonadaceae bacterium]MBO6965351.1 aspartyl/asparaginyl beta-hydroxylase domain-containing protein [Kordiimonadaceae bacterium]
MDIGIPVRDLGPIHANKLSEVILGTDDSIWKEEAIRQEKYAEVHYNTESLIMIFCDHDNWPSIDVVKGGAWDLLSATAMPIMHDLIAKHYTKGGTIIRAMAAKLLPGKHIVTHTDKHPSFHHGHRIHIPIKTNKMVRFMIEGRPHKFEVGHAYEINNQLRHGVMNNSNEDRIHFIFDYIPGAAA